MSEVKTIKLKFKDKIVTVPIFPTYNDCITAFINNFNIDDKKKKIYHCFTMMKKGINFHLI